MSLNDYVARWRLTPDGEVITTPTSRLLPVVRDGLPAMLKLATIDEERRGADLMTWWDGDGAARVLAHDGDALLMERATGGVSLVDMACNGGDDEATRIICAAAARLHTPRPAPHPASLVPLERWFASLWPAAANGGELLRQAAMTARALLASPQDVVALHGDLHHENVLDFGSRGWLAIDPKGLVGERGFDFANILRNPDAETAIQPGRFARQASVIAAVAGLERPRLLQWTLALCGLSAAWYREEGDEPDLDLAIAELAIAELETAVNECSRLRESRADKARKASSQQPAAKSQ